MTGSGDEAQRHNVLINIAEDEACTLQVKFGSDNSDTRGLQNGDQLFRKGGVFNGVPAFDAVEYFMGGDAFAFKILTAIPRMGLISCIELGAVAAGKKNVGLFLLINRQAGIEAADGDGA